MSRQLNEYMGVLEREEPTFISTGIISSLIQQEWALVDSYNGAITTFKLNNAPVAIDELESIVSDIYIHIGQLEKILQTAEPAAENLDVAQDTTYHMEGAELAEPILIVTEDLHKDNFHPNTVANSGGSQIHALAIGPQYSKNNPVDWYHYEIDFDNKIYTKVYDQRYLSNRIMLDNKVVENMQDADAMLEAVTDEDFKEVKNKEYLQTQRDWIKSFSKAMKYEDNADEAAENVEEDEKENK